MWTVCVTRLSFTHAKALALESVSLTRHGQGWHALLLDFLIRAGKVLDSSRREQNLVFIEHDGAQALISRM